MGPQVLREFCARGGGVVDLRKQVLAQWSPGPQPDALYSEASALCLYLGALYSEASAQCIELYVGALHLEAKDGRRRRFAI